MKVSKTLLAGLLAVSAAGLADAQTVVHIVGSTAFRSATVTAITHILQPGFTYAYAGTSFTGANQHIFTGTTISNSIPVIIKTSWSGSVGGIQTVAEQFPISTFLTNTTPQSTAGAANAPANYDPPSIPDVTMSDGVQSTTPFPTPVLTAQSVGVVPFRWVRNTGSPVTLTNVTPLLAQALWLNGDLPLALFTGNPADSNTLVYATGRDPDSGTRKTAFAETGVGVFSAVVQYAPTNAAGHVIDRNTGDSGPIVGQEFWPAETVDGIFFDVGQAGYASGGDLAFMLGQSTTPQINYLTYLGLSDSTNAINAGAVEVAWNGHIFTDAGTQNGSFTFWAYEQLDYRSNFGTVSPNGAIVANLLATQIKTADAIVSGELLSTMHVVRAVEGGVVTPNY